VIGAELLCRVGGQLLEGPAWVARAGELRFVDIRTGELLALKLATGSLRRRTVGGSCSAWIARRDGGSVVACSDSLLFLDALEREEHRLPLEPDLVDNRANDAKCDPRGRLWVGTMSEAEEAASGALYRLEGGMITQVLDGVTVSNGLGWSPDGKLMYYVDSPTRRIDVLDYDTAGGTASNRRCFVDTRDVAGFPDGLAVDAEGCLWVAFWNGHAVHRFAPGGELVATVRVDAARPTSCAFVGAALDRLVVTTAAAPDGTGGDVFVCVPDVTGVPVGEYDG
jgi:sugar lactone lactonase YvrE